MIQPTKPNLLFFSINFKGGGGLKKYGKRHTFIFFMEDLPNLMQNFTEIILKCFGQNLKYFVYIFNLKSMKILQNLMLLRGVRTDVKVQ